MLALVDVWTLRGEPAGPAYEALLRFCLSAGASELRFITFDRWAISKRAIELLDALASARIEERLVTEWPGTRLGPELSARLWIHRFDDEVLHEVLRYTRQWGDWGGWLPDDPHLLRADKTVMLGSITSEHDLWLRLIDSEHAAIREIPRLAPMLPSTADSRPPGDTYWDTTW